MADTTADPRAPRADSFLSACLAGTAHPGDVDDWVDDWHESDAELTLAEFLGFTSTEYAEWARDPRALTAILDGALTRAHGPRRAAGSPAAPLPATTAAPTVTGSHAPACGCPDGECDDAGQPDCYFSATQNLEGPAR